MRRMQSRPNQSLSFSSGMSGSSRCRRKMERTSRQHRGQTITAAGCTGQTIAMIDHSSEVAEPRISLLPALARVGTRMDCE